MRFFRLAADNGGYFIRSR